MVLVKPTKKYVLTVAPDMEHVKHGLWTTQSFYIEMDALDVYRAFTKMGAICYLETIKTEKVETLGNCEEIRKFWN